MVAIVDRRTRSAALQGALVAALAALAASIGAAGLLPAPAHGQPGAGAGAGAERGIVVNRVPVPAARIAWLERRYRVRLASGRYWYDARSGAWGVWGGPALGVAVPGLDLGGPLRADASGGGTGVYINGRELHPLDVAALRRITPVVLRGRYWVDASGTGGYEGGPPIFNLYAMAAQARAAGGGGRSWISRGPGGGMGSDGECIYYISGDASASVGC